MFFPISSLAFLFLLLILLFEMLYSPSLNNALAPLFSASEAFAKRLALFSALLRALGTATFAVASRAGEEVVNAEEVRVALYFRA